MKVSGELYVEEEWDERKQKAMWNFMEQKQILCRVNLNLQFYSC